MSFILNILFMSISLVTAQSALEATCIHECSEVTLEHNLYPVCKPNSEGMLTVSDHHTLYYATYGNPQGTPVVVLHGGPGFGCDDSMSRFFNQDKWHIVMFDQRASGRSTPLGCLEENSPQHSIADLERLRNHLGIDKWAVFGGSWGSMLALLYAQEHPECCLGFILRGVFLGRHEDYTHLFCAMGKIYPEAYEELVTFLPKDEQEDLFLSYWRRIMDPNPEIHLPACRAFMKYDMSCATFHSNPDAVNKLLRNDSLVFSVVRLFFHYCKNSFFVQPNQVLANMGRIDHLPAIIVHGRWDAICLPDMAFQVHQKLSSSTLWFVTNGGHSANDPAISQALAHATDCFLTRSDKRAELGLSKTLNSVTASDSP